MSWDQRFVDPIILESLKPLVTLRAKSALNKNSDGHCAIYRPASPKAIVPAFAAQPNEV
jgi:hypothetical protein